MKQIYFYIILFLLVFANFSFSQNHKLIGYWHNWDMASAPYIHLDSIDSRYDIVNIAFAIPTSNTDMKMIFVPEKVSPATFKNKINTLKSQGKKVILSIGGGTAFIDFPNDTLKSDFVGTLNDIIEYYQFDGIDIDIEHGDCILINNGGTIANPTNPSMVRLIDAIKEIMNNYRYKFNKKMMLTFAPETAYFQGGQSGFGSIWGGYLPIIHALRDSLDILQVQLYNSGSMYGIDDNIYYQGTADFIIAMTEAAIQGFNTNGGMFYGIPANKIAIGLPACTDAAGGGYLDTSEVAKAVNYLRKLGPKPGNYTLVNSNGYDNILGMMTWSINWDALDSCNGKYAYADNYERLFEPKVLELPSQVAKISPVSNAKLQSDTAFFKWNKANPEVNYYQIEISKGMSIIYSDSTLTDTTFKYSNFAKSTEYLWKVRAKNATGWGNWSTSWKFTTKDPEIIKPDKVTLIYPPNGFVMTSDTVNFIIKPLDSNVTTYIHNIYENGVLIWTRTVMHPSITFPSLATSDYDKEFTWNVVATYNGVQGEPSETWTFRTRSEPPPPPVPDKVVLIEPQDSAVFYTDTIRFVWRTSAPSVKNYHLEIFNDEKVFFGKADLSDTSFVFIFDSFVGDLSDNYYWRVRASNSSGWGEWSDTITFAYLEQPLDLPSICELLEPANNSIIKGDSVFFKWSWSAPEIISYEIRLMNNDFTYYSDSTLLDTILLLRTLPEDTEFKWAVRAYNKSGWGEWSTQFKFKTDVKVSISELVLSNNISPNPATEYIEINLEKLNPTLKRGVEDQEEIKFYNYMGKCVMTETIHPMFRKHRMNIEHLPAGVYFIKVGDKFVKFVKE